MRIRSTVIPYVSYPLMSVGTLISSKWVCNGSLDDVLITLGGGKNSYTKINFYVGSFKGL